ncbi:MBL fold metallo-hydrolase [Cohnella faecalis]|uniref:MBL fold metallo-hydrolase n=2 Tax=Cohnella faecalis TaxID=2315694 RepID=A0A398CLT6_9BACL|nr:MBL fold metallo-hydrolase [Cohnella faecalis]
MPRGSATATVASDALVELQLLTAGFCRHPEFLTLRGGALKPVPFPAGFAVIRHPRHGYILFDTGYSARFFDETKRFPALLYRMMTPVTFSEKDSAVNQLRRQGIEAEDIRYVVLSHFHADHVAGIRDFPHASFLYKKEAYAAVKNLGSFASVKAGYLPGLLPENFEKRSLFIEEANRCRLPNDFPFLTGYDLLGDGSLIAVDVPGHAAGQIGLFLSTASSDYFLCADAVWSSRAFQERRKPHAAARLIMADHRHYADTFERLCLLHRQYPHIRIIPSHCGEALLQRTGEEQM